MVKTKRVYEPPTPDDGRRVLVERLWPRGLTKERAALAEWLRDVAPSPALHEWYGHDPARWPEFQRRYRKELAAPERRRLVAALADEARRGTVTLVYATRSTERNGAVVLRDAIADLLGARRATRARSRSSPTGRRPRAGRGRRRSS
ncbi:MAG TPA: DUF488 family protein [Candidatus Binatia bacterium]|nr:DUF488 family protein [Candidatus Binatia bacterium]